MFTADGSATASPPLPGVVRSPSLTRDQVIQLGQHGSPWAFAPLALRALGVAPADAGVRFLLAANLAKLLLRTPALEQLAALEGVAPGAASDPQVRALRQAVEGLPRDEVSATERIALARSNVQALAARGVNLHAPLKAWEQHTRAERWFRGRSGNIVRLVGDVSDPGAWRHLAEVREAAGQFAAQRLGGGGSEVKGGVVVEGVDPPWLLLAAHEVTGRTEDGFTPRVWVVQADALELLDGLACADLASVIADERVEFRVGPGASERLLADLRASLHALLPSMHIVASTLRERLAPGAGAIMETAGREQAEEQRALLERIRAVYAGRDRAWWSRRFAEGLAAAAARAEAGVAAGAERGGPGGAGEGVNGGPLRVLVPTYRHSTFVRHSAEDLVAALVRRGIEARVLMEEDDHSCMNTSAYGRAVAAFEPDLFIVINYPRVAIGAIIPENVPYVCWVQDAMPHLFTREAGGAFGPLEFLAGHTSSELFERFGYPRERALRIPVVASEEKFSADPVPAALRKEHECELAYVSHHGETPGEMAQRLMREANDARVARCVARIAEQLPAEIEALSRPESRGRIVACVRRAAADFFGGAEGGLDARAESSLVHGCALRLADRMLRHQMLAWADAVCERRGWRFRLYGKGWERHPSLARRAQPPLEHGLALRASYQAAAAHLHGTIHWNLHQRVTECILSGGVPLIRLKRDDMQIPYFWTLAQLAATEGAPAESAEADGELRAGRYVAADHPALVRYWLQLQRLGFGGEVTAVLEPHPLTIRLATETVEHLALNEETAWLAGDMALTGFSTEADLEARLAALVERPALRSDISRGMRRRAARSLTYGGALTRLLNFITEALGRPDAA